MVNLEWNGSLMLLRHPAAPAQITSPSILGHVPDMETGPLVPLVSSALSNTDSVDNHVKTCLQLSLNYHLTNLGFASRFDTLSLQVEV